MKRRGSVQLWAAVTVVLVLPSLAGCAGFFPPINGGGGGGGGTGSNRVYVANQSANSIGGFTIGATGTLTAVNNSPVGVGFKSLSMVVTPNNGLLYVGAATGVFVYFINSDGSLTTPNTGSQPAGVLATAMAVSPDGQWLIVLDGTTQQLDIFQINLSTGALTSVTAPATYSITSGVWQPSDLRISPDGTLIFAALGTAGDVVFTFNTTTGVAASSQSLTTGNTATGDFGLAVSPKSTYLYIARSGTNGGVAVYSIGSGGTLTPVTGTPFAAGSGTFSVALDNTGTYVYAANRTDGTISGYTIVPGATTQALSLTPLNGSPYASGAGVQALGLDATGKFLLAIAVGGGPDLTMYSFDVPVPGKLDPATSVATGVDPAGAVALALTH
ncbi:MAG TPA: beta-propeller fold lactonase family protein [Edaphobacter sp.]|jgi:6-phosphogluconolactonase (cycloisomerase 2 family)|nr:beta-propeller fold lactonase family protein [Edaphobacter sp.]